MQKMAKAFYGAVLMTLIAFWAQAVVAQSPFTTALTVNGTAITHYELTQRAAFIRFLGISGDAEADARDALITDRLAEQQAKRLGIKIDPADIESGMAEFASRGQVSAQDFLDMLAQAGISQTTFADFVRNGLYWREVVGAKLASKAAVSEIEIDREIANATRQRALRLKISEIVLPLAQNPTETESFLASLAAKIPGETSFAEAARLYSASPSAANGGQLDWLAAGNLPPALVTLLLANDGRSSTPPVMLDTAAGLFQLNDLALDTDAPIPPSDVDYIDYSVPAGDTAFLALENAANFTNTCGDFVRLSKEFPWDLDGPQISTKASAELPADLSLALAALDPHEFTLTGSAQEGGRFIMLCERRPQTEGPISREAIRDQLFNQKIGRLSEVWEKELRAEAIITENK